MNNKVAIFTDIHIGVHQNSSYWIDVSLRWVEWFKKEIDKQGINDVIFCGDFFHHRDEVSLIALDAANKILDILEDKNIYMITGNHDCYYKETSEINSLSIFRGRKNIRVFETITTLVEHGCSITFCPWGTHIKDIPKSDIIFGHFELQNFRMNAFKVCENGDDPEVLLSKAPLAFSGHFHSRDEKTFNGNKIIYIGNPFEMDFADANQFKGFYTLDVITKEYKFFRNSFTPKHIKIYLSKLIQLTSIEDEFQDFLPNNIVKLVVDKNISTEHLDMLVAKFTSYKPDEILVDYDVNYNKIKVQSDNNYDLSAVSIEAAIEEFVNMLDIQNKREVIEYTVNLLQKAKL